MLAIWSSLGIHPVRADVSPNTSPKPIQAPDSVPAATPTKPLEKPKPKAGVKDLPQKPSAPPSFDHNHPPIDSFICPRLYVYRGKTLNCDSALAWDGENLRPILSDTPEALAELDAYQARRRNVQSLRYVGGAGALLALTGSILERTALRDDPRRVVIRNIAVFGGLSIAAGSFAFSLALLRSNESRLGRAVQLHNQAKPKDPITLQFSTGIDF